MSWTQKPKTLESRFNLQSSLTNGLTQECRSFENLLGTSLIRIWPWLEFLSSAPMTLGTCSPRTLFACSVYSSFHFSLLESALSHNVPTGNGWRCWRNVLRYPDTTDVPRLTWEATPPPLSPWTDQWGAGRAHRSTFSSSPRFPKRRWLHQLDPEIFAPVVVCIDKPVGWWWDRPVEWRHLVDSRSLMYSPLRSRSVDVRGWVRSSPRRRRCGDSVSRGSGDLLDEWRWSPDARRSGGWKEPLTSLHWTGRTSLWTCWAGLLDSDLCPKISGLLALGSPSTGRGTYTYGSTVTVPSTPGSGFVVITIGCDPVVVSVGQVTASVARWSFFCNRFRRRSSSTEISRGGGGSGGKSLADGSSGMDRISSAASS